MTKDKYLWLVNKDNPFDPDMLEQFDLDHIRDTDGKTYIEHETHLAYQQLNQLMIEKYGIALFLVSAGRTVETQQQVMDDFRKTHTQEETLKTVALPGTSEHHTGLALDVHPEFAHSSIVQAFIDKLPLPERLAYLKQPDAEQKKQMYALLHQELEQFGFIVRYSADKQDITGVRPERWHIRYVGQENAKAINQSGLCLEEYVEMLEQQENSSYTAQDNSTLEQEVLSIKTTNQQNPTVTEDSAQ